MKKTDRKKLFGNRRGIVDVWNAFMVEGARFDEHDIPACPTTAASLPDQLISWPEAKRMHKSAMRKNDREYHVPAFIHFYIDDAKFDGVRSGVWLFPWRALEIIQHFDGIITPDFSMCQDFPEPVKMFAVYRMRAFGFWVESLGVQVINNVRWGTRETWEYCFTGIPRHTVVAIGTVASNLRKGKNKELFDEGLKKMAEALRPTVVIVYGSENYESLKQLAARGVKILQFDSETKKAFDKEHRNE